jgi:predicted aldo/keto reductase-like oxidoreductase
MDKYLDEQLQKLKTDHIDFYLVHGLNSVFWANLKKHGLFDFLEAAKADGRVKNIGFSFHDQIDLFKEIVDAYDWSFCQIQYNFMDENYQAGLEGLNYAAKKGLGIVIMEPLRGGKLAKGIPVEVQEVWDNAVVQRTPAEWALRFIWDNPAVGTVLSGMNALPQVEENIAIASRVSANSLSVGEKATIDKVRKIYKTRIKINCTNCKYCMPCPAGVNIPNSFNLLNDAHMYDDLRSARMGYTISTMMGGKASSCSECGSCEGACPQQLPIRELIKEVVAKLEA